jgi:hypothetical protein
MATGITTASFYGGGATYTVTLTQDPGTNDGQVIIYWTLKSSMAWPATVYAKITVGTKTITTSSVTYSNTTATGNFTLSFDEGTESVSQKYSMMAYDASDGSALNESVKNASGTCTLYPKITYTACTAPTSFNVGTPLLIPTNIDAELLFSWTAGTAGTYNSISGYKIYYSKNIAPTINSTVIAECNATDTSVTLSASNLSDSTFVRGDKYYFKIQTIGTKEGYDSPISSASCTVAINSLPDYPTISNEPSVKVVSATSGGTVSFTVSPGTDDDGQTYTAFWGTSPTATGSDRKRLTSETFSQTISEDTIFYFWTYDGLEYSESYSTSAKYTLNTMPVLKTPVVTGIKLESDNIPSNITYTYARVLSGTVSGFTDTSKTLSKREWILEASGSKVNSFSLTSDFSNLDLSPYLGFGQTYRLGCRGYDGYDWSNYQYSDYFYIAPVPKITAIYNNFEGKAYGNEWDNYFYDKIRIDISKDTGLTKTNFLLPTSVSSYKIDGYLTANAGYVTSINIKISDLTAYKLAAEEKTYDFTINAYMVKGNSKTVEGITWELKRPSTEANPGIVTSITNSFSPGDSAVNPLHFFTQKSWVVAFTKYSQDLDFSYEFRIDGDSSISGSVLMFSTDKGNLKLTSSGDYFYATFDFSNIDFSAYYSNLNAAYSLGFYIYRIAPTGEKFITQRDLYITFIESPELNGEPGWNFKCYCENDKTVEVPNNFKIYKGQRFIFDCYLKGYNNEQIIIQPQIKRMNEALYTSIKSVYSSVSSPYDAFMLDVIPWSDFGDSQTIYMTEDESITDHLKYFGNGEIDYFLEDIAQSGYCCFRLKYITQSTKQTGYLADATKSVYLPQRGASASIDLTPLINGYSSTDLYWTLGMTISDWGCDSASIAGAKISFEYCPATFLSGAWTKLLSIKRSKTAASGTNLLSLTSNEYKNDLSSPLKLVAYDTDSGFTDENGDEVGYVYLRCSLIITLDYTPIIINGVSYMPLGDPDYKTVSTYITILNNVPTVAYRKNQIGINTNNFEDEAALSVVNIASVSGHETIRLTRLDGDEVINRIINIKDGTIDGFIVDGGSY